MELAFKAIHRVFNILNSLSFSFLLMTPSAYGSVSSGLNDRYFSGEIKQLSNLRLASKLQGQDSGFEAWIERARERLLGFGDANYSLYMSRLPYVTGRPERLQATLFGQITRLEESWVKLEPRYGEINTFSAHALSHKVLAYDPRHYQNIVTLETKEKSQKVWMWDLELNVAYLLHSELGGHHKIQDVVYSPWNTRQLVMFGDVTVSILDLEWSKDFKPYGVYFTSSKITKIINLGSERKQLVFMTASGRINVLTNNDLNGLGSGVSIAASFEHPEAKGLLVHPYNKNQLISYSQFEIKVWDLNEKKLLSTTYLESTVLSGIRNPPIFLPSNPDHVLVWAEIGKLHRFDLKTSQRVNSEPTHWACARSVDGFVVTKQPERLVVLCESDLLRIYDTTSLDLVDTVELMNKGFKGDISLQGDRLHVWFHEASMMLILDAKTFDEIGAISEDCDPAISLIESSYICIDPQDELIFRDLEFYPFEKNRMVSSNGEALYFWSLDENKLQALPIDSESMPSNIKLHMHPKNPNLIFTIDTNGMLQYWDFWSQAAFTFPDYLD